jgi:uncharacterized membrane protein
MAKNQESENQEEHSDTVGRWLPLLVTGGFMLITVGIVLVVVSSVFSGTSGLASGGVIIFIGPFPIVFGVGPDAWWLILVGLVLAALSLLWFIVARRKTVKK